MTKSELKARNWLKAVYPDGYIKKIPDFKATGSSLLRGIPDYFVIYRGHTVWVEVKYIHGFTFNFNEINDNQYVEFKKFLDAGYDVMVLIVVESGAHYTFKTLFFSEILQMKQTQKSIHL